MTIPKERRRHMRQLPLAQAQVYWQDGEGVNQCTRGRCVDISESGLRIEAPSAIPLRTIVTLRVEKFRLDVPATVRHYSRRGAKHFIGLEFNRGMKWTPPEGLVL